MRTKIGTEDVPQADDLTKVLKSLSLRSMSTDSAARALGVVPRQVAYYRHAARVLGYLDGENSLTRAGEEVIRLPDGDRLRHVRRQFERTACVAEWVRWAGVLGFDELRPETAQTFLNEMSALNTTTARRRAKTLQAWYAALRST